MHTSLRALCAIATLATGTWCQALTFNLTDLGAAPGANSSSGLALNEAGVVVGTSNINGGADFPTRFSPQRNVDLLHKAGQTDAIGTAVAINRSGMVAGSFVSREHPDQQTLFLKQGKQVTFSAPPEGGLEEIYGMNDAGTVIGSGYGNACVQCAFIYKEGAWTVAPNLWFLAIAQDGRIAGATDLDTHPHAALFQDGNAQPLPDLGGEYSWATGLNAAGVVVGTGLPADVYYTHAFLVRNGQVMDLHPASGFKQSGAVAINDHGWVIGYMELPFAPGFSKGGQLQNLNHFLPADQRAQWRVISAAGINNKGQIAGTAERKSDGMLHAVLLTPLTAR